MKEREEEEREEEEDEEEEEEDCLPPSSSPSTITQYENTLPLPLMAGARSPAPPRVLFFTHRISGKLVFVCVFL